MALTMLQETSELGPVYIGAEDHVTVALLLDDAHDKGATLRLYSRDAADCLASQGIAVYPSVHPDFVSRRGTLRDGSASSCLQSHAFETVDVRANRLVVVQSGIPAVLSTAGEDPRSSLHRLENANPLFAVFFVFKGVSLKQ